MKLPKWLDKLFNPPKRIDLRFVDYGEADKIIKSNPDSWRIAREEDHNRILGMVWIERIEDK